MQDLSGPHKKLRVMSPCYPEVLKAMAATKSRKQETEKEKW